MPPPSPVNESGQSGRARRRAAAPPLPTLLRSRAARLLTAHVSLPPLRRTRVPPRASIVVLLLAVLSGLGLATRSAKGHPARTERDYTRYVQAAQGSSRAVVMHYPLGRIALWSK